MVNWSAFFQCFPSALHDVLEDRVAAMLRLPVFSPDFCQLLVVCRKDSTLLFFSRKSYMLCGSTSVFIFSSME